MTRATEEAKDRRIEELETRCDDISEQLLDAIFESGLHQINATICLERLIELKKLSNAFRELCANQDCFRDIDRMQAVKAYDEWKKSYA